MSLEENANLRGLRALAQQAPDDASRLVIEALGLHAAFMGERMALLTLRLSVLMEQGVQRVPQEPRAETQCGKARDTQHDGTG